MKRWLVGLLLVALAGVLLALAGVLLVIVINRSRNPVVTVEGIGTSGKGRVHTERNEQGEIVEVRIYSNNYPRPPPPVGVDRLLDLFKRFLGGNGKRNFVVDADLAQLKEMHHLHTLYLSGKDINGEGLVYLKGLPVLRSIDLTHTRATDASLVHLQGLQLFKLSVPRSSSTDLGLKHWLAATDKPSALGFGGWRITDAGLMHLKRLTELKSLRLNRTKITDAGMAHLKGMTRLLFLTLPDQLTDVGLEHLKGMTELWKLDLYRTKITDAGLVHLKGMTNLRELTLPNQITDAGLVHLKGLAKLQALNLEATKITGTGLTDLQTALPNCKIVILAGISKAHDPST